MADDLLRVVQLSRVLAETRSLVITRIPTTDTDAAFWGKNQVDPIIGFTQRELQVAIRSGGVKPLLLKRLGPGTYRVEWIGPGGVVLYVEEITIPNLQQEAVKLELEEERRKDLQSQARREARDKARQEREERGQRDRDARLEADQAAWSRDVAGVHMREAARRVRAAQGQLLVIMQNAAEAGARQASSFGEEAASLRRQARTLQRQTERLLRVRLGEDGGSLRRQPEMPELLEEQEPCGPAHLLPPPPPWHLPLVEELERIRSTDLEVLHARVLEHLQLRAEDLFPLPSLDPLVTGATEHLMPQVTDGFVPWLATELFPPRLGPPLPMTPWPRPMPRPGPGPGTAPHRHWGPEVMAWGTRPPVGGPWRGRR